MKFKIDQNLPIEAADLLMAAGHDAMTVYQQSLGGASDERIVDACKDEGRILITADLDLSDIRRYPPHRHPDTWCCACHDKANRHCLIYWRKPFPCLRHVRSMDDSGLSSLIV